MALVRQKQERRIALPRRVKKRAGSKKPSPVCETVSPLTANISAVIRKIPKGKVATYGLIAALAGNPKAARQVVWTLNSRWRQDQLPWQRLISSKGKIALPMGGGFELQKALLEKEGVIVGTDGAIDLKSYLWRPRQRRESKKKNARK